MLELFTALSRVQVVLISVAVAVGSFGLWMIVHDGKVASRAQAKQTEATNVGARNAQAKQSAVPVDGASRRLQREYCPGCSKP